MEVNINYLAVLVSGIVAMAVGAFWYSPAGFGKIWMELSGLTAASMDEAKKKGMAKQYLTAFVGTLLMAYVLAHFVAYAQAITFLDGVAGGFWACLGFVAPVLLGSVLWEGKPWKLYFLNVVYYFVVLGLMGGILAVWY